MSRLQPSRRLSRARKALNLVRNLWFLRGELWALLRRKPKAAGPAPIPLVCVACGHDLTKPCLRGRWKHVIAWPADVDGHPAGTLVEVSRQKQRAGGFQPDYDLELVKR